MFQEAKPVRRHFKVALSGKWKTGKTRAALSFPKTAVIDTHRGTDLYDEQYDFKVLHATSWKEMEAPIEWLQKNATKEGIETLVIDDVSNIYDDLINTVSEWRAKKSGDMAPINQGDWGQIKRKWKGFLQLLLRLDLSVVLVIREKDEYVDVTNNQGQEVRKKTGNSIPDVDRQTLYLFDFILEMYCEDDKKRGTSKHLVRVDGTRHRLLPKYSVHDITNKHLYEELFEPMKSEVEKGNPAPTEDTTSKRKEERTKPSTDDRGAVDRVGEMLEKFSGPGDPDSPKVDTSDIKVLMSTCNKMTWPDGSPFRSDDGKKLIKALYKVESTKDLKKYQADFLIREFGEVLSGRAALGRDETDTPYVRRLNGTK